MPTIVMTTWRRPEYTKSVLDSLSKCIGIEKYKIAVFAEPGFDDVLQIVKDFKPPCEYSLTINPTRLGCGGNIYQALSYGFSIDDYVIMIEDDIILAKDALRYFEHCKDDYKNDKRVFTVCGYARSTPPPEMNYVVKKIPWFTPWGWATWKDRWAEIDACLSAKRAAKTENNPSWDIVVNKQIRGSRLQIEPVLSRTQNVGAELGQYCPSAKWHQEYCFNDFGAWSIDIDPKVEFVDEEDV